MLADTSDIHALARTQQGHADDLTAVATDLTAARVPAEAFGTVGAPFLDAFNAALADQARHVADLAERLAVAGGTSASAADAYHAAEVASGQAISMRAR